MVVKLVLLLPRNIQERNRINPQLQTHWAHCLVELSPSSVQAELQKPSLLGKGLFIPFRERIIDDIRLSCPQPLLITESIGNFPD